MNKIYRSIWNAASGTHVAVAETTKAKGRRGSTVLAAGAMAAALAGGAGTAEAALVNLCTGVSLPASEVTGLLDPLVSPIIGLVDIGGLLGLSGIWNGIASGAPLGLSVLDTNGNVLGATNCNAILQPATPKGISLGGNQITGLGDVTIADARGINSVAIGNGAITYSTADNANQIAIGPNAKVGTDGTTDGINSVAIGGNALATKDNSVALGGNASATGASSTALGNSASATGDNSTALGNNASATGASSTALGNSASATGDNSTAVGNNASVNGANSTALGNAANVTGANSTALGNAANVTGANSTALGNAANVTGANSTALGNNASVTAANSTALGNSASATAANSVALGAGSAATTGAQTGYTAYGLSAPQTSAGEVSVGSTGNTRKITNVAAGSAATDAVNVSQLQAVDDGAVKYDNPANKMTVTLGGPLSTDGGVTNGTTITNVHQGALSSTSTDAVNGSQLYASNLQIDYILNSDTMTYFHANSTKADSLANGADSVAVGGAAVADGAGSVAMGDNSHAGSAGAIAIGQNSDAGGVNSIAIGNGAVATGSVAVGAGASAGNGGAAFGDNAVASAPQQGTALGNAATVTADRGVALGAGSTAARGGMNGATEKHSNVAVTSTEGAVSVGSAGNERQITNVAGGTEATDAVNVRQLDAVAKLINVDIDSFVQDANAGTAGAMAMAGMPQASYPGKSMAAAGMATYQGQSALSVGVSTMSDNGRWVMKFSGSANTRGNAGAAVGVGFNF
jgi:autotransporter adhesin